MNEKKGAELHVELPADGGPIKINLDGEVSRILLAWSWLTYAMCNKCGLSLSTLAEGMPQMIETLRDSVQVEIAVDRGALEHGEEGGGTP